MAVEDDNGRESLKQYFLPPVEIKDYKVMIDGKFFFHQPIKNDLKKRITLERLRQAKVMITQQDVYYIILILKNTAN